MEAAARVVEDLLEEGVRLPLLRPEGHGDGLAEVVELQAARGHRVHDGGVVDDADLDAHVQRAKGEVGVGGGAAARAVPGTEAGMAVGVAGWRAGRQERWRIGTGILLVRGRSASRLVLGQTAAPRPCDGVLTPSRRRRQGKPRCPRGQARESCRLLTRPSLGRQSRSPCRTFRPARECVTMHHTAGPVWKGLACYRWQCARSVSRSTHT